MAPDSPLTPLATRGLSPPDWVLAGGVGPGVVGRPWKRSSRGVARATCCRPVLADEGGPVGGDRPVGLVLEQHLGDPGAGEGVDEPEEDGADEGKMTERRR